MEFKDLIVLGIAVVTLFLFLTTFKSMKIRLFETKQLLVSGIFAVIFGLLFMFSWYFKGSNDALSMFFEKISLIPLNFIFVASFFYYEGLISYKPSVYRFGLFLTLCVINALFTVFNLLNVFSNVNLHKIAMATTFFAGTFFHGFAIWVMFRIIRGYNRTGPKLDLGALILVGNATFWAGIMEVLDYTGISHMGELYFNIAISIAGGSFITGIFLLLWNNYKWGDYIFHIPIPVHNILIYSHSGVLVYSRSVKTGDEIDAFRTNDVLISSALSAFSTFFKEILGSQVHITHINADPYEFFFKPLVDNAGTIVLVTSGANYFLDRSINKFESMISEKFLPQIKNCCETSQFEKPFDEFLIRAFPYVVIEKESNNSNKN